MAIYELEDRIYFDGAIPADVAEVQEDTSVEDIENTAENTDTGDTDNSENVSIAPETPSTENSGDNEETGSDDGSDEVSSDSESNEPALSSLGEGGSTESDDIAALLDSITDTTIIDDFLDNQNFLIISADNENFEEIANSLNDNTTLIIYDSDDTYDSIIEQLKVELGDSKAVNIGIVDFDGDQPALRSSDEVGLSVIGEQLTNNQQLTTDNQISDFLDDLKDLQYYDGELNVINIAKTVNSFNSESFESNLSILSTNSFGDWIVAEDSDTLTDYFDSDSAFLSAENLESNVQSPESINEIYFIDSAVEDIDTLLAEIPEDATVIELEEGEGIDTITEIINSYSDIDAVHIISQANYAQILLGDDVITADNIDDYSDAFSSWNDNLSTDADILFYGCDIAKEASGQAVINQIAEWTVADIAASTDITGSPAEAAEITEELSISLSSSIQNSTSNIIPDWDLEYTTGSIEATVLTAADYTNHLEIYAVTEATDNGLGDTEGTLSWAVAQSNATTTVDDTINFALESGSTITIAGAGLTISDDLTINGNGVTVSFEDGNADLVIDDGVDTSMIDVTINNLTVEYADDAQTADAEDTGSMLQNSENLTITNTNIDDIGYVYAHIPGETGTVTEIYFIDSMVDDYENIVAEIPDGAIIIMLAEGEGLNKITEIINSYSDIDAVHIISQANYAQILLGNDVIANENISEYQEAFSSWNDNLSENADILFYGCEIAEDAQGQEVLNQIAEWTGADIAASTDVTGGNGGNWNLEFSIGAIETAAISVVDYNHHLLTYTVTEITDDGTTGTEGSLSWAIYQSNDSADVDDNIVFCLDSGDTVTLSAQALAISDSVTIDGFNIATTNNITVKVTTPGDSSCNYRVFEINAPGETINISNMTIQGGDISADTSTVAGYGGGIYIAAGTVNLNSADVCSSKAYLGGGIYSSDEIIIQDSSISGNTAVWGGGIYNSGVMIISSSTISSNSASDTAGGIFNFGDLTIASSTISGNTATSIGGIYNNSENLTIASSTISGNTATSNIGGIQIGGIANILNSVIVNNTSPDGGDIVYNGKINAYYCWYGTTLNTGGGKLSGTNNNSGYTDGDIESIGDNGGLTDTVSVSAAGNDSAKAGNGTYVYYNSADGYYYGDNGSYYKIVGQADPDNPTSFTPASPSTDKIITDQRGYYINEVAVTRGAYQYNGIVAKIGEGASWTSGTVDSDVFTTIEGAVNVAGDGDTIVLAGTSILMSQTAMDANGISITKNLTITGEEDDSTSTTVRVTDPGTTTSRVFKINADGKTVNIENMIIKGGDISSQSGGDEYDGGGGIFIKNSVVELDNVTITGSKAISGGAVEVYSGTLNIDNSILSGNNGTSYGGAIYISVNGILNINNSTLDNNSGNNGGCIDNRGTLSIKNSTISNNNAVDNGGGIYTEGNIIMDNCTVYNNSSGNYGGGIENNSTSTIIMNSTISCNEGVNGAGGVDNYNGNIYLVNSIIINNTCQNSSTTSDIAHDGSGGVYAYYSWYNNVYSGINTQTDAPNQTTAYDDSLGDLANNGGDTYTMAVTTGPALGNGTFVYDTNSGDINGYYFYAADGAYHQLTNYSTTQLSPSGLISTDQRGVTRTTPATIGAYQEGSAPVDYEYRTIRAGDWNCVTTDQEVWERRIAGSSDAWATVTSAEDLPDYEDKSITVRHAVNVTAAVTIDETTIFVGNEEGTDYNGSITVDSGIILTVADDGTSAVDLDAEGDIVVNGTISIGTATVDSEGAFNAASGAVTFTDAGYLYLAGSTESVTIDLGNFTQSTSTVVYDGATQAIAAVTYYNLTLAGSGTLSLNRATVNNNLTVSSDSITISGSVTYGSSSTLVYSVDRTATNTEFNSGVVNLSVTNNSTLTVDSSKSVSNNITIDSGSTLSVTGTGTELSATGSTGTTTVTGTLSIASGSSLDADGALAVTGTLTNSGTVYASSTVTLPTSFTVGGTFVYDGDGQTVALATYENLTLDGTGTVVIIDGITVSSAFAAGNSLTALTNSGTLYLEGSADFGTAITSIGGTVAYSGGTQTVAAIAYNTLSFAGSSASSTKTFAAGTTKVENEIAITDMSITLTGSTEGEDSTVQVTTPGTTESRVFNINASGETVTISNMTIKGGDISTDGTASEDNHGGSIYIAAGTVELNSVTVSSSKANIGGAIYNSGSLAVTLSTISNNIALSSGGGIYNNSGTVTVISTTINSNSVTSGGGGGIYNNGGNLTVNTSTINSNTTDSGGGAAIYNSGTSIVVSSTICNNSVTNYGGGGIYNAGTIAIISCTVSENSASEGGGIYNSSSSAYILNSIVIHNTAASGGDINVAGGTLSAYYSWYNSKAGSITDDTNAPNQITVYSDQLEALANNGGDTETMKILVTSGTPVAKGTYVYDKDGGDIDGYYFLAEDGKYYKLTDYSATPLDTAPEGLITTDQRGETITDIPSIGAYFTEGIKYEYRTIRAGDWNCVTADHEVWERRVAGSSNDWTIVTSAEDLPDYEDATITVRHAVTVTDSITVDQTTVIDTGSITVDNNAELTVYNGEDEIDLSASGLIDIKMGSTITINSGATVDSDGNFTSSGTVSFDEDGSEVDDGILYLAATDASFGTLDAVNGTVVYDGAAQNIDGENYYNLTFDGSGNKTLAGNIGIAGSFTVTNGTFVHNDQTVTYNGTGQTTANVTYYNLTLANTGTSSATTTLAGTVENNLTVSTAEIFTGGITYGDSSTLVYTVSRTSSNIEFGQTAVKNLEITNNSTVTLNNLKTISNTVTVENGSIFVNAYTLDINGAIDIQGTLNNTGTVSASSTVTFAGSPSIGGTFVYDGENQTVAEAEYYNLTLAGTGDASATTTLAGTVSNNLTVSTAESFAGNITSVSTLIYTVGRTATDAEFTDGAVDSLSITNNSTLLLNGDKTLSGTITVDAGSTLENAHTLDVNGALTVSGTLTNTGTVEAASTADLSGIASVGGTFVYNGTGQTVANVTYNNLTLAGTGTSADTATLAGTVNNNLTVSTAETFTGGITYGDSSTLIYTVSRTASNIEFGETAVKNLEITDNSTVTLNNLKTISNSVTVENGSTFVNAYELDINGAIDIQGTLTNTGTVYAYSTVTLAGSPSVGGTFVYDGEDQTIAEAAYSKLTLDGSETVTIAEGSSITVSDEFSVSGNYTGNTISNSGTLTLGGTADFGSITTVGGTVTYNGSGAQTVDNVTYSTLNLSGSNSVEISDGTVVTTAFTVGGSVTGLTSTGTFTLGGTSDFGSVGTIGGTVVYNGSSAQTVAGLTYNNLSISAGAKTIASDTAVTVSDAFVMDADLTLAAGSGGTTTLELGGSITDTSGTITAENSTLVSYTAESSQNVIDGTYYDISFSGAGTKSITGATAVNNNLTLNDPDVTLSIGSYTLSVAGDFSVSAGSVEMTTGTLELGGSSNDLGTFNAGTGTVVYNGTSAQTVENETYHNLTLDNGSDNAKTLEADLTVNGNLVIESDAVLDVTENNYAVNLKGDFTNSGTFNAQSGTVNLIGSTLQSVNGNGDNNAFHTLVLNNSAGAVLTGNTTIDNELTLSAGLLTLGAYRLTLNADAVIGGTPSASNMIVTNSTGVVRKKFSEAGSFLFTIGTNSSGAEYSPLTVDFTSGNFASGAYVDARVINSKLAENTSSTNYLNRYWVVESSGINKFSADVTCQYLESDVVGNEAEMYFGEYANSTWTKYSLADTANHTISGTGLTSFCSLTGINKALNPDPTPTPSPTRPDVNNGEMINDGTQFQTRSSWRNSIDNGASDSIDSSDGFEPNEVEGIGLMMDSLITFGASIEAVANGEYGVGSGAVGSGIHYDGEYGINANSGVMVNGEYGIGNSGGIEQEFDSGYNGMVDLSFDLESDNSHINYGAIAAYNDRHPLFKTELDLLLEKI